MTRFTWRLALSAAAIMMMCIPVIGATQPTATPMPANAYRTQRRSVGLQPRVSQGWRKVHIHERAAQRAPRLVRTQLVLRQRFPQGIGHLRESDRTRQCIRGRLRVLQGLGVQPGLQARRAWMRARQCSRECLQVDSAYGRGWECHRGFRLSNESCAAVRVPANAYLRRSGDDWSCDRGYMKRGELCAAVDVPANGYLDAAGTDWSCDRGYRRTGAACVPLKVPPNAHLDYSGDDWRCDAGYRRTTDSCVQQ